MASQWITIDLIFKILVGLPAKSVLRFKSVCKEWCNLIDSPLFINLHLQKSLEPDSRHNRSLFCTRTLGIVVDEIHDPLNKEVANNQSDLVPKTIFFERNFIGSCNGLVCFSVFSHRTSHDYEICFIICNPTTRTFKSIHPSRKRVWTCISFTYGFGYDSEQDDYKIVAMSRGLLDDIRIYSLKADSWSFPNPPPPPTRGRLRDMYTRTYNGVFANKMLHFFGYAFMKRQPGKEGVCYDCHIARFDVASEKWIDDDLSLPDTLWRYRPRRFGELDGWLYICTNTYHSSSRDVWIMEEYGSSWKKLFHLPNDLGRDLIVARFKNGDGSSSSSLLLQHDRDGGGDGDNSLFLQFDNLKYRPVLKCYHRRDTDTDNNDIEIEAWPTAAGKLEFCIASLVTIPRSCSENLQQIDEYLYSRFRGWFDS